MANLGIYYLLIILLIIGKCISSRLSQTGQQVGSLKNKNSTEFTLTAQNLKLFGETCKSSEDCARTLTCKSEICSCTEDKIARMPRRNWSKKDQKQSAVEDGPICAIRAGSSCSLNSVTNVDETTNQVSRKYSETLKTFGKLFWTRLGGLLSKEEICVENARCDGYTCICNPGFYNHPNGACLKRRSIFEKCTRDQECGDIEMLICNRQSGRCECPSRLIFDIRTLKCHVPAGLPCEEFNTEECVPFSDCTDSLCVCRFGYRRSLDGTCAIDYGLPCGAEYPCADVDLSCRQGRCACKFYTHQYYNDQFEECLGKVSAPCDLQGQGNVSSSSNTSSLKCTENAICSNSSGIAECKCVDNFAEDINGKCVKSFGSECLEDGECDEVAKLVCINGKCRCPDELQVFDMEIRKCKGLVGSRCTSNSSLFNTFRDHGVPNFCIENASCEEKVRGLDGRCECKFGYELIPETRRCGRKSSKFFYGWNSDSVYPARGKPQHLF